MDTAELIGATEQSAVQLPQRYERKGQCFTMAGLQRLERNLLGVTTVQGALEIFLEAKVPHRGGNAPILPEKIDLYAAFTDGSVLRQVGNRIGPIGSTDFFVRVHGRAAEQVEPVPTVYSFRVIYNTESSGAEDR